MSQKKAKAARRIAKFVGVDDRAVYDVINKLGAKGKGVFRFAASNGAVPKSRRRIEEWEQAQQREESTPAIDAPNPPQSVPMSAMKQVRLRVLDGELPPGFLQETYKAQDARNYARDRDIAIVDQKIRDYEDAQRRKAAQILKDEEDAKKFRDAHTTWGDGLTDLYPQMSIAEQAAKWRELQTEADAARERVKAMLAEVGAKYEVSDDPKNYIFEAVKSSVSSALNEGHDGFFSGFNHDSKDYTVDAKTGEITAAPSAEQKSTIPE